MKFVLIFSLLCGIFSAYSLYVGFETGTVFNIFRGESTSDSNQNYSVDDSPVFYWVNMAFLFMSSIFCMWFPINFYKKTSKVSKQWTKRTSAPAYPAPTVIVNWVCLMNRSWNWISQAGTKRPRSLKRSGQSNRFIGSVLWRGFLRFHALIILSVRQIQEEEIFCLL